MRVDEKTLDEVLAVVSKLDESQWLIINQHVSSMFKSKANKLMKDTTLDDHELDLIKEHVNKF
ncbi:hypothetical protein [Alkalibacillus salilacus]|uniref:Uncharacterized protein n=1 Tax=Alkalibacillus salilacus TaxID=284582 RepID=A0ABT9VD49_9BACI|nr:hypothetical protein [Alkalibacillus salilacus]MDQ0158852.1 hypothetical protein [Alkalibacillus salilacus]